MSGPARSHLRLRRLIGSAVSGLLVAVSAATSVPVAAHDADGRAEVVPARVAPGGQATITGAMLRAGSVARAELVAADGSVALAEGPVGDDGTWRATVTVPADLPPRYYEVHVVDDAGTELVGYLEVAAEGGEATAPGSSPLQPSGLALAAIIVVASIAAAGVMGVAIARGRRPVTG